VRFDFIDRRRAERFAELLDETGGGRRHHSRVPADEELAELVAIGHTLSAARPRARVDNEFRTGLRAMLVATAERDGIGRTAPVATEPIGDHAAAPRRGLSFNGRRIRARGAIVIGVAAGAMAVSGISAASENAAPGDALYGVKRSTERAQLAMAGSDVTRGQLSLDFARTRLAEAAALPGGATGFAGVLNDMDADTRQGVKLLTEAAVVRTDKAPLSRIDTFVTGQRQTFKPLLDQLTPADQERAGVSLSLLNDVQARAEELRAGLSCGTVTRTGADSLGPRLRGCMAGKDSTSSDGDTQGHGQRADSKPGSTGNGPAAPGDRKPAATGGARPEKTDPATAGTTTVPATDPVRTTTPAHQPGDSRTKITPTSDTPMVDGPAPTQSPATGSGEDEGFLGGLLGGIFDS
jgi:uncharacterized protein DUF5667